MAVVPPTEAREILCGLAAVVNGCGAWSSSNVAEHWWHWYCEDLSPWIVRTAASCKQNRQVIFCILGSPCVGDFFDVVTVATVTEGRFSRGFRGLCYRDRL